MSVRGARMLELQALKSYHARLAMPFGVLGVIAEGETLTEIDFLPADTPPLHAQTPLAQEVCSQLKAYAADPNFHFTLPLQPHGTPYQQRVWQALLNIPTGQVESYGALAKQLGSALEIVRTRASVGLTEKIFNDDFEGLVIYVNRIPQDDNPVMEGIFISDARPEKRQPPGEPITIVAARGRLIADPGSDRVVFGLEDGGIHVLSRDRETYQHTRFSTHDLLLTFGDDGGESFAIPKGLREMTLPELQAKIEELRRLGVQQWAPLVEIHKKFAIPFAALIFGFLCGVAMGVLFRRGEKLVSFALSVGIAIVYYVFLLAGEPLGKQGRLHPFWAMWAANIFFVAATALLFRKVLAETPFTLPRPRAGRARRGAGAAP